MTNSNTPKKPSLFWPLFLIGLGIIFLLSNFGLLPPASWDLLVRFWPVILIVIGLDLLLGRKSALGAIITSVFAILLIGGVIAFVFFAGNASEYINYVDLGNLKRESIKTPLLETKTADIFIDWTGSPANLYPLSDSNNLIEGDIAYYGNLYFDVSRNGSQTDVSVDTRIEEFFISTGDLNNEDTGWNIGLSPTPKLNLTLDAASGPGQYQLNGLALGEFKIDGGSGPLNITLPDSGQVYGLIDGGSGPITLILPDEMEAKITVNGGSGSFRANNRFNSAKSEDDDITVWVTHGFRGADNYLELEIDQGSGSIEVK